VFIRSSFLAIWQKTCHERWSLEIDLRKTRFLNFIALMRIFLKPTSCQSNIRKGQGEAEKTDGMEKRSEPSISDAVINKLFP